MNKTQENSWLWYQFVRLNCFHFIWSFALFAFHDSNSSNFHCSLHFLSMQSIISWWLSTTVYNKDYFIVLTFYPFRRCTLYTALLLLQQSSTLNPPYLQIINVYKRISLYRMYDAYLNSLFSTFPHTENNRYIQWHFSFIKFLIEILRILPVEI